MIKKEKIIDGIVYTALIIAGLCVGTMIANKGDKTISKIKSNDNRIETMILKFDLINNKLDRIRDEVNEMKKTKEKK